MKKVIYIISTLLKSLLLLWVPILLIEETFLLNYIDAGIYVFSLIISILCLIMYIKTYKKINKKQINCYLYNIINTILLVIFNIALGYLFLNLIDLNVFHQCLGSGWDCFLFGIEYLIIGIEYALFSVIALIIWLIVRLIKYLNSK